MKLNLDVATPSDPKWVDAVMADFDSFLLDHADGERKASAMAMGMIAKYPDRVEIIPELIETAIEELEHFRQVYALLQQRGLQLVHNIPEDRYIKQLLERCHSGRTERFLDRLLIGSIVETRGAERFKLVAEALEDPELKRFYKTLWTSEAKHSNIYVKFALKYFPEDQVYKRLQWWVEQEAEILEGLEIRAAMH